MATKEQSCLITLIEPVLYHPTTRCGLMLWAQPGPVGLGLKKVAISDVLPSSTPSFSTLQLLQHMEASRGHAGLIPAADMVFDQWPVPLKGLFQGHSSF